MNRQNDLDRYTGYVDALNGTISIFGYNDIAKALIKNFPGKIKSVVSLDTAVIGTSAPVRVISMEAFEENPSECVVIVDEAGKFDYLDALYAVMHRKGMNLLSGIKVRYPYSPYTPWQYDLDYIQTRDALPMEFTIPHEATVRLIDCVKATGNLEGDILELGTGYGGSTYFIAHALRKHGLRKKIYTIDRFKNAGYLPNLAFDTVKKHLKDFPEVEVIQGEFDEQLETLDMSKISFCFFDAYATPHVLKYVYPKIVRNGMLLIDNYTHGCDLNWGKPMADLFFKDKAETVIRIGGVQGLVVKQ